MYSLGINYFENYSGRQNFNGWYHLPYSQENMCAVNQLVLPKYTEATNHVAHAFKGGFPGAEILDNHLTKVANKCQASLRWLKNNSERFGVSLPDTDFITVVTDKDVPDLINALKKIKKQFSFLGVVKMMYKSFNIAHSNKDLPEHIKLTKSVYKPFESGEKIFADMLKEKTVIEVSSPDELIAKMLHE